MARSVVDLVAAAAQREQPDEALGAIAELRDLLDELEELQVDSAREQGWSWSEIARPLRVSRQAVHRKFAKRLEQTRAGAGGWSAVGADARRCIARARREAAALGHDAVGTDHLLLGLLGSEVTEGVLRPLALSPDRTRSAVEELRRQRARRAPTTSGGARGIPFSLRAREALERSLQEALRLGSDEIGSQHLLLALLRDEASGARLVLDRLGVAPAAVESACRVTSRNVRGEP